MDLSLEYKIVTKPNLAWHMVMEYQSMVLPFDRVLRDRQLRVNKSDMTWSWSFNMPCTSLKGILVLFQTEQLCRQDTSRFYNPKVQKVSIAIEGKPSQPYTQGMQSFEQYNEICKYFTKGKQMDNNANEEQRHLQRHDLSMEEYVKDKYALWLDFRTIGEDILHWIGRVIGSTGGELPCKLKRKQKWLECSRHTFTLSWMPSGTFRMEGSFLQCTRKMLHRIEPIQHCSWL